MFFELLDTIKYSKPKVFILENVKNIIKHDKGKTYEIIMNELESLKQYEIYPCLMNTLDYGIPQQRTRVFFVGIQRKIQRYEFRYPEGIKLETNIYDYLDEKVDVKYNRTKQNMRDRMGDKYPTQKNLTYWQTDLCMSRDWIYPIFKDEITCITRQSRFYISKLGRVMTPREHLRLQGFPDSFKIVVSDSQAYNQVGNTMTVDVLVYLMREIFECCDII